jgi:hypothetical protein
MSRAQLTSTVEQNTGGAVAPFVAGKNAIINGGMDIWQRGTSISLAASTGVTYTADRWCTQTGTNQAITISRQATADTTNLPNIQYALRYQRNSGQTGTGTLSLATSIESTNSIPYAGKAVTLSFYARAGADYSAASSALPVYLYGSTGTDQNIFSAWAGSSTVGVTTATLTTNWQRFVVTGTVGATVTQLAIQTYFSPTNTARANDYFEITGVQLELGSTATTFSRAGGTLQGELAACQRYYLRYTASEAYTAFATGVARSSQQFDPMFYFPVQMRIKPSAVDFSTLSSIQNYSGAATSVTAVAINTGSPSQVQVVCTSSSTGLTQNSPYYLAANNSSNAYVGFSAEL